VAVREVCVTGREDEQGLVKPHAFVVPADGHEGGEELAEALKAHAKERLAPYKYPRSFEWRDELPKNDRGKIARKQLETQ
jgi:benzoate-CoA ligase